jgi:hypothetical protein
MQTILEPIEDCFLVTCPYCGEAVAIYLEPDVREPGDKGARLGQARLMAAMPNEALERDARPRGGSSCF